MRLGRRAYTPPMHRESIVRLEGASVRAVHRRSTHVAVVFPQLEWVLPRADSRSPAKVEAELRIWEATVEASPQRLPRRLVAWQLACRDAVFRERLPAHFSASGDVRLRIEFPNDEPLVVVGTRVTLRIARNHRQLARERDHESEPSPRRRAHNGRALRR